MGFPGSPPLFCSLTGVELPSATSQNGCPLGLRPTWLAEEIRGVLLPTVRRRCVGEIRYVAPLLRSAGVAIHLDAASLRAGGWGTEKLSFFFRAAPNPKLSRTSGPGLLR